MEITFEKVNNEYIAEFEITTDSNLHIEKKCASSTKLYQRTNGGGWDLVDETKNMQGAVDDFDLSALVYPKFIKVVCNAEPLYAEVTTSGEVTEIKSQSKEIEVTSNGTTEVTPDAGFAYLNSVKVKTNVAGSEGGSAMEYLDTTGINIQQYDTNTQVTLMSFGDDAKIVSDGALGVYPMAMSCNNITRNEDFQLIAMSFNKDKRAMFKAPDGEIMSMTWMEFSSLLDPTIYEVLNSCPRITEEEFYNLNA